MSAGRSTSSSSSHVEITSKALAMIQTAAAMTPVDVEGLLFGCIHRPSRNSMQDSGDATASAGKENSVVIIESFKLTGRSRSILNTAAAEPCLSETAIGLRTSRLQKRQEMLGWCSIRAGLPESGLSVSERKVHDTMCSAVKSTPAIGYFHRTVTSNFGAFVTESSCMRGELLVPVDLKIRSIGSTASVDANAAPLPVLGVVAGYCKELDGLANAAVKALAKSAEEAVFHTGSQKAAKVRRQVLEDFHKVQQRDWIQRQEQQHALQAVAAKARADASAPPRSQRKRSRSRDVLARDVAASPQAATVVCSKEFV